MKRKLLNFCSLILTLLIILQYLPSVIIATTSKLGTDSSQEMRGIWLSFLDLKPIVFQKTESEFTKNAEEMFSNIINFEFTDVYFHVRPFSDALYKSSIFPQSDILTGTQGKDCGYDPLEIILKIAHKNGLKLHAWVNPYRIKNPGSKLVLSPDHPASKWIKEGNTDEIITLDNGGVYYNPCSRNVINLTKRGIEEIIKNYPDIDGIHLDDYFYPTTDKEIDTSAYSDYKSKGGTLSLEDWRIENVNCLVKETYELIKNLKPSILFGISPAGSINYNYTKLYSDVKTWLSSPGYVDYLCPQIYYGFKHGKISFDYALSQWSSLPKLDSIKLYIGLAAYKINNTDSWADSGANEWIDHHDIISREILACRKNSKCNGFALFRYDSLFNPESSNKEAVELEISSIRKLLSH